MESHHQQRDFHHPYEPYHIQNDFMNAVYDCLRDGKVGIFESPTGTGKSLSLICGSLTWLRDHHRQTFERGFDIGTQSSDEPLWIIEHAQKLRRQEALSRKQDLDDRIAKVKAKEKKAKDRYENGTSRIKRQKVALDEANGSGDEAQFVLDDYNSDTESDNRVKTGTFNEFGFSTETQTLMANLGYSLDAAKVGDGDVADEPKIFFCSRTHSQLTQFSSELARVKMPPAITPDEQPVDSCEAPLIEEVKHITLGSRKNLCINSKVSRLGNAIAINERCLELQQSKSGAESKCPHMPTKETEPLINEFRDHALAKIRDIEDLGVLGKKLGICPYYASRQATKYCEASRKFPFFVRRIVLTAVDCYFALSFASSKICS